MRLPFWVHQGAELCLALVVAVHGAAAGSHGYPLVGAGLVILAFALVSDGALGAWRLISPKLHQRLDFAVIAGLVAVPFVAHLGPSVSTAIDLGAALLLAWMTRVTSYSRRKPTRRQQTSDVLPPVDESLRVAVRGIAAAGEQLKTKGPRALGRMVGRARHRSSLRR